jgi:hypothetical protein
LKVRGESSLEIAMVDRFALWVCVLCVVIAAAVISLAVGYQVDRNHQSAPGRGGAERVVLPIEYVYTGRSQDGRMIRSAVLSADFVCSLDTAGVRALAPRVVDDLALLLEDRHYAHHAADVLGCIGSSAAAAVPALERALAKEERVRRPAVMVQPDFQLDFALRSSLKKITGNSYSDR